MSPLLVVWAAMISVEAQSPQLEKIELEITSQYGDGQVFQTGDELSFLITINRSAYLYVIYQTSRGELIQLIPNNVARSHYFNADVFIAVPGEQSNIKFTVDKPYGSEMVYVYAIDRSVKLKGHVLSNGLIKLLQSIDELEKYITDSAIQFYGVSKFKLETRMVK